MAGKRVGSAMTAGELLGRLRRHYIEPSRRLPGGIFVPEVGMNGGYGAGRRCDAIYVGFTTTSGPETAETVRYSLSALISESSPLILPLPAVCVSARTMVTF